MYLGVVLLSAATLTLEITLTRVFSLSQWYHFAFMAVAIALLGFAASGSFLAVIGVGNGRRRAALAAGAFSASALALHPLIYLIPFDAYRLAIDGAQFLYLFLYVLVLTVPFFCSGLALGALLSDLPQQSGPLYGANLTGSGAGCLLALAALPIAGAEGMPVVIVALGATAVCAFAWTAPARRRIFSGFLATVILLIALSQVPGFFRVPISPYKALSIVSAFQGSRHILSRWNAFSRVDVVEGPAIHSAPGLSLAFPGAVPTQPGLMVDGDNLRPIPQSDPASADSDYASYLPTSVAFRLRPQARALVLQAGTGVDVLVARREKAQTVTAVDANALVVQTARDMGAVVFDDQTQVVIDNGRSFLARSREEFDVIVISLAESFRAVTSGDFSLSENYVYTVEGLLSGYNHLANGGLLVITRWAQWPPTEDLRVAAMAASALRRAGVAAPAGHVVVFRSFQTVTILVRKGPFTPGEIATLRDLWQQLSYDAVYFPGMVAADANRFTVLPDARQYETTAALLGGRPVPGQAYDISPSSDDRPFFFHFFRWSQVSAIVRNLGKTWQPFGGAGYLALVALLVLTIILSAVLIILPLLISRGWPLGGSRQQRVIWLCYFASLGIGFLFSEIPLMQRYILYLGQPVHAMAAVLFSLLASSGLGSLASHRLPDRLGRWLLFVPLVIFLYPLAANQTLGAAMPLPLAARLVIAGLSLFPLGFLLGMWFPWGLRAAEREMPGFTPWAWAANGCASVVGSVLAPMIAVSGGFTLVLLCGAAAYLLAVLALAKVRG